MVSRFSTRVAIARVAQIEETGQETAAAIAPETVRVIALEIVEEIAPEVATAPVRAIVPKVATAPVPATRPRAAAIAQRPPTVAVPVTAPLRLIAVAAVAAVP